MKQEKQYIFDYNEKYDKKMMDSAIQWSEYSSCQRRQVGAVLAKDGREIASGYNGTISGSGSNNCEDEYYQCQSCKTKSKIWEKIFIAQRDVSTEDPLGNKLAIYCKKCNHRTIISDVKSASEALLEFKISITKDSVIHAERNIIAYCAKHGIPTDGCTMFITLSPCQGCAVLMAQAGIKRVIYKEEYKDTTGIKILREHGIEATQYKG